MGFNTCICLICWNRYKEEVQKYILAFRNLGLITSCPKLVLEFNEKIGSFTKKKWEKNKKTR